MTIHATAQVTVQPGVPLSALELELQADFSPRIFPVPASPDGTGAYVATVVCPFIGSGVLRVKDALALTVSAPLDEVPIDCSVHLLDVVSPAATSMATATTTTASQPCMSTIPGMIEFAETTFSRNQSNRTQTFDFAGEVISDTTDLFESQVTQTHDGIELCTEQISATTLDGEPRQEFTSRSCFDSGENFLSTNVRRISGTSTRVAEHRFTGELLEIMTTDTVGGTSSFDATVRFEVPEGFSVETVRIRPAAGFQLSYTRPTDWMFPGSVIDEGSPANIFVDVCPDGAVSPNVKWEFPATVLTAENKLITSFTVNQNCSGAQTFINVSGNTLFTITRSGMVGALQGPLTFEADIMPVEQMLMLSSANARIGPEIPPTFTFGTAMEPETTVTATVVGGGMVGDMVTVNLDIFEFDETAGAHLGHTPIPDSINRLRNGQVIRTAFPKGQLAGDGEGNDPITVSCVATLGLDPSGGGDPVGSCEVTYKAGVVSGIATIRGVVDASDPVVEADVDVRVGLATLVNAGPLFQRPLELFRDPATEDKHPVAFFLDPTALRRLLNMQRDWEDLTVSTSHPMGTYLSMNDMSLPEGGLFDIAGTWVNSHNSHRLGTSVDVNQSLILDGGTGAQLLAAPEVPPGEENPILPTNGGVRVDKQVFREICENNGGFIVREPSLHCDWRGRI